MTIVVATTDEGLVAARRHLGRLALDQPETLTPSATRRLLLAPEPDLATGHRAVLSLRNDGYPAVLRPATGPQLAAWTRHTEPLIVGDRLTVAYVWSEHDRAGLPNVVEIDPAGGFGSAQHPATRLLLEELAYRITGGERVLDLGCGNGILGLSALRLGAARLTAVDIDPGAVESTRRNAALNQFEDLVDHRVDGVFDVVVANIGRAALIELGADLAARVAPDGWVGVSGFSPPQCDDVAAALRPLTITARQVAGEWSGLSLGRVPG